jgi:hypothetical protein
MTVFPLDIGTGWYGEYPASLAVPAGIDLAGPVSVGVAGLLGHTALERLYGMVLAFPNAAERLLTEQRVPDAVLRYTLLAETALRLNRPRDAVVLASAAATFAERERPVDASRLLPAGTVLADATVLAGAPDAIQACTDLVVLAGRDGDVQRVIVATGIHAVAIFHQRSCREAEVLLRAAGRIGGTGEFAAAIRSALDALVSCCARRGEPHWPPATNPLVTSGGLVRPVLARPFLADRLQRWPGCHDCGRTARRSA